MRQSSAAMMLLEALKKFLKGGSDAILEPTKTVASIVEEAVALPSELPAVPSTSYMDLNNLPRALMGTQLPMTRLDPAFQTDTLFLLFLGLMASISCILVGAWISSTFYESGYQCMVKLTDTYKTLLAETHADHKDWKALQANLTCLRTRRLQRSSDIIKAGVTYVSDLSAAYNKLNEQFYSYMIWADEQLQAAGYDQAVILSALSITPQEELISLRNSLDDKQREVDALLEAKKSLTKDNHSLTEVNDKYLEKIDEQTKKAEASDDRIRELEALVKTGPAISQSDAEGALQKQGQDTSHEAVQNVDSVLSNDKAHEANEKPQEQLSSDEAGNGSQDILSKLDLSSEDFEALMANIRQKVAAEQHHKENAGRKRRRQNQRKKRENNEQEGAEEKAKEEEKAE